MKKKSIRIGCPLVPTIILPTLPLHPWSLSLFPFLWTVSAPARVIGSNPPLSEQSAMLSSLLSQLFPLSQIMGFTFLHHPHACSIFFFLLEKLSEISSYHSIFIFPFRTKFLNRITHLFLLSDHSMVSYFCRSRWEHQLLLIYFYHF